MRFSYVMGLSLLLAISCDPGPKPTSLEMRPDPKSSAATSPAAPTPQFTMLEHIGYSFDDAGEYCLTFDGDGLPSDPDGISGKTALRQAYGSIETRTMPDGREALCMIGENLGSKGCTFDEGHWVHRLVKADGTNIQLPNDVRAYRVHHREIDAWLWQAYEHGVPYEHIGTHFDEFCSEDQ